MAKQVYREGVSPKEKKRFEKYLSEDEELVLATGYGKIYMRQKFLYYIIFPGITLMALFAGAAYLFKFNLGVGLGIGFVFACLLAWFKSIMLYNAHRYLLTTRRVIIKGGFFSVKLTSALYDKITHIEVEQSFFDRWVMHHGSVVVNTAGASKDELVIKYVDSPIEFKNILERLINREREQYGRQTGSVVTLEGELVE